MGQKRQAMKAEMRALRNEVRALRAGSLPAPAIHPVLPEAPPVMRFGRFGMPEWSVPKPAMRPFEVAKPLTGVLPEGMAADMAQDDAIDYGALAWGSFTDGLQWLGYPYLAELAQRPEYRRISETIAKEMTRKWIKIQSTGSDDGKADKVRHIELAFKRLRVQERVRRAIELDGFFGRGQIFIDTGDTSDSEELRAALVRKPTKIGKGDLKRLTVIEPMWTYAAQYNSSDPLRGDYYRPRSWYVQGRTVHASRLITFVSREVPDLLKPAYSFGGLSMSQMARPYIENWLRTRQSISDLLHSFSVSGIKTNMAAVMQGSIGDGIPSGEDALFRRAQFFNAVRDNRGMMMLDRDTEEYFNVSTPLGTLDHLQAQSQEQMASVSGIPLVVLLGITPSGLNASSEGELQAWNSWIEAQQEQLLARPLNTILEIVQLSEFGEIDPEIGFAFEPLGQLTPEAKATVRKTEADTAAVYIQAGVLAPEEERQRIARDENSPYASLDLEDSPAPEPPMDPAAEGDPANDDEDLPPRALERPQAPGRQPMGREPMERPTGPGRQPGGRPDLSRAMAGDKAFSEGDHPRGQPDNAGQFGPGGGGGAEKPAARNAKPVQKSEQPEPATAATPTPARTSMHETRSDGKTRTLADGSPLPTHAAALKIPPAWTDVRIAHTPDAPLQATGRDAKGRPQAIYSEEHTAKAAAAKFARIHELQSKFADVLAQNDKARRDPKTRDVADCLNLIMRMGVRPGSDSDTGASVKAYGATTLEGKHVVRTPDGVRLQFVGKKGVAIDLPVTDPALAANLWARAQKAGQDGRLFGGVTDKSLLDHTHSMDGGGFKTKDMRTRLGTQTAADIVSSMPKPTDRKAYDKAVKTVATAVAKALGNTPAVALTSYISPAVFAPWQLSA